jgi:succinoglycan biosynthesis transport protein ExoP
MAEADNGGTLRTCFVVLRRWKWWVISLALLGLAASVALSLQQAKQYSATAQLLVQSPYGQGTSLGSTPQEVTATDVQTDLQIATSAPVVALVRAKLGSAPSVAASEVAQTNVIALTAVSSTPARAALIANTYAGAFVKQTQVTAIGNLTTASTALRQGINSLGAQIKSLQKQANAAIQVNALINQQAVLKEEVAQLQINWAAATSGVGFITPAYAPTSPSSPKPVEDALLGLAAGLMLGLGVAVLKNSLDDTLTSKEAAERSGGAPAIVMVPMVSSWRKRNRAEIASRAEPTSPAAEAYRSLRTSLQFARQSHELRTLLVTSPAATEGKTSTLANLGVVFAQAGERVALVSCDLRRPRLGRFFEIGEQTGLTTVLLGQQTLEQALQQVPGYDGLWVLGAGAVPPNPAELLDGPQAREIFSALRENFDLVLVDSPPALPVTDALVLSKYADGTLLVVAAGQTRRAELRRAAERFAQADSPIVGIVLNKVTMQSGYGSGYGYGYGSYAQRVRTLGSRAPRPSSAPSARLIISGRSADDEGLFRHKLRTASVRSSLLMTDGSVLRETWTWGLQSTTVLT